MSAIAIAGLGLALVSGCKRADSPAPPRWLDVAPLDGQTLPAGRGGIPVSMRAESREATLDALGPVLHIHDDRMTLGDEVLATLERGRVTSGIVDHEIVALRAALGRLRPPEPVDGQRQKGEEGKLGKPGSSPTVHFDQLIVVADADLPTATLAEVYASHDLRFGMLVAADVGDAVHLYPFEPARYVAGASTYDTTEVFTVDVSLESVSVGYPGREPVELGAHPWRPLEDELAAFRRAFPDGHRAAVSMTREVPLSTYIQLLDVLRGPGCAVDPDGCRLTTVVLTNPSAHGKTLLPRDLDLHLPSPADL